MHRSFGRTLSVSFIVAVLLVSAFSSSVFAAKSTAKAEASKGGCNVTSVHLNGNKPPTVTCLDNQVKTQSDVTPAIGFAPCNNYQVLLSWNGLNDGLALCLSGNGLANLGDYPRPAGATCAEGGTNCTWFHQASAYRLRKCAATNQYNAGDFYAGYNGTGQVQKFYDSFNDGNFDGSAIYNGQHALSNDSLSSVLIAC